MILVFHVINSGLPGLAVLEHGFLNYAVRSAEFGVELFFAVSGYVISGTLARSNRPVDFVLNRMIRIFPVLWLTILVITLAALAGRGKAYPFDLGIPLPYLLTANLLALPGVFPLPLIHPAAWSLSYEFAFYLVSAGIWWGLRTTTNARWPIVWCFAFVGFVICLFHPRTIPFIAGVLVALYQDRFRNVRAPGLWLVGFLALWTTIKILTPNEDPNQWTVPDMVTDGRLVLLVAAIACLTVGFGGLTHGRGMLCWLLGKPWMLWFGTVSYSLYLWHPIVLGIVKRQVYAMNLPAHLGQYTQLVFLLVCLPLCAAVSWASQRYVEAGLGRWLKMRVTDFRRRLEVA